MIFFTVVFFAVFRDEIRQKSQTVWLHHVQCDERMYVKMFLFKNKWLNESVKKLTIDQVQGRPKWINEEKNMICKYASSFDDTIEAPEPIFLFKFI